MLDMEYPSFFIVLIYFPAKLTKVCRYKDFYLFIFPSANIIEGAEALSPYLNHLELCVLRSTWERNHVTDVLHTCNKENQALETETETSMRT